MILLHKNIILSLFALSIGYFLSCAGTRIASAISDNTSSQKAADIVEITVNRVTTTTEEQTFTSVEYSSNAEGKQTTKLTKANFAATILPDRKFVIIDIFAKNKTGSSVSVQGLGLIAKRPNGTEIELYGLTKEDGFVLVKVPYITIDPGVTGSLKLLVWVNESEHQIELQDKDGRSIPINF